MRILLNFLRLVYTWIIFIPSHFKLSLQVGRFLNIEREHKVVPVIGCIDYVFNADIKPAVFCNRRVDRYISHLDPGFVEKYFIVDDRLHISEGACAYRSKGKGGKCGAVVRMHN